TGRALNGRQVRQEIDGRHVKSPGNSLRWRHIPCYPKLASTPRAREGTMRRHIIRRLAIAGVAVGTGWGAATVATAGPADTPLPNFSDGKPAVAVYYAFGVIKNNNLETDFVCTN